MVPPPLTSPTTRVTATADFFYQITSSAVERLRQRRSLGLSSTLLRCEYFFRARYIQPQAWWSICQCDKQRRPSRCRNFSEPRRILKFLAQGLVGVAVGLQPAQFASADTTRPAAPSRQRRITPRVSPDLHHKFFWGAFPPVLLWSCYVIEFSLKPRTSWGKLHLDHYFRHAQRFHYSRLSYSACSRPLGAVVPRLPYVRETDLELL